MEGLLILVRVANGTAKLDGFKRVSVVKMFQAGNKVGVLAHDPEMVRKVTRAQRSNGIKKNSEASITGGPMTDANGYRGGHYQRKEAWDRVWD
jgi:hypothetical protein